MYVLGTDCLIDLVSREESRAVFEWLRTATPGRNELFASVVSFGIVADTVEAQASPERDHWRRLLSAGRRQLAETGGWIDVDLQVAEVWARIKGLALNHDTGEEVGDDERLVIATAIARDFTLVTRREAFHEEIIERTTLKLVEP